MLAGLDPVATLPYLALDNLWLCLSEAELLQCRLVSRDWKKSVQGSRQWKRFLPDSVAPQWQAYFRYRKAESCWRRGIFSRDSITLPSSSKICVGEEYIYVGNYKQVIVYSRTLDVVQKLDFEKDIVSVHSSGKMVAVVVKDGCSKYTIFLYRNLKEVYSVEASSCTVGIDKERKLSWVKDNKLYLLEGEDVKEYDLPGEARTIVMLEHCLALVVGHPVSRGGGFSLLTTRGGRWNVLHEGVNTSPMVLHFGDVLHNRRVLTLVNGRISESGYTYRIVVLSDLESGKLLHSETLPAGRYPYFRAALGKDSLVYTANEKLIERVAFDGGSRDSDKLSSRLVGIHLRHRDQILVHSNYLEYWKDMSFSYRLEFSFEIIGSATQDKAIFLWSKDVLTALSIP